jgi:hypothetical protein
MPIHDWQFWVVTAAAIVCAINLVRQMIPRQGAPACGNCAAGAAACSRPAAAVAAPARISPLRVVRD